jgi:hypothetical protein
MHEAAGEGAFEGAQLAIVEAGYDDFHLKFAEVERSRGRLRADNGPGVPERRACARRGTALQPLGG